MLQDGEKGVIIQRDKQTYAVAPHLPCGVVSPQTLRKLADAADHYNIPVLKVTSASRIALVGITEDQVDDVWKDLQMSPGAAVGLCVRSVKACPGTTFCKRGQQDSLGIGMLLDEKYHGLELPGKFKIGVSGCPNQCAENCIKDVALMGTVKGWMIQVGGNGGSKPRLSRELIRDISTEQALSIVDKIIHFYGEKGEKKHRRLGALIDEMGFDEFKKAILGDPVGNE
jgi:NAD(P)H-nitrite reductase large subunit